MQNVDLQQFWVADVTTRREDAPMTALAVARAPRPKLAVRLVEDWLARARLEGEVTLRGPLADHPLDEAMALAGGLDEREVRAGSFGLDDPRAAEGGPLPQLQITPAGTDALRGLLFDGADHTYALLDGAAVFGLPEMLETSGLQHVCLLDGMAAIDYGTSAPWLVRLTPDHRMTRMLTDTGKDKGALSWAAGPGMLIRSPLSLTGLRKQFRTYTMVLDPERNRRMFFRFYDPRTFRTLVVNAAPDVTARFMRGIRLIACLDAEGNILTFGSSGL